MASKPVQIIKLVKPAAGQTEKFYASFDGPVKIDFTAIAKGFNCEAFKVQEAGEVGPAMQRALSTGGPCLVEFVLSREPEDTEGINVGHWDLPRPEYLAGQESSG